MTDEQLREVWPTLSSEQQAELQKLLQERARLDKILKETEDWEIHTEEDIQNFIHGRVKK
jgi:hypothetical protein